MFAQRQRRWANINPALGSITTDCSTRSAIFSAIFRIQTKNPRKPILITSTESRAAELWPSDWRRRATVEPASWVGGGECCSCRFACRLNLMTMDVCYWIRSWYRGTRRVYGNAGKLTIVMPGPHIPEHTKHLCKICTMLVQRRRRWTDVVQLLHNCFVFAVYVYTLIFATKFQLK